jgi:hypothetical protein
MKQTLTLFASTLGTIQIAEMFIKCVVPYGDWVCIGRLRINLKFIRIVAYTRIMLGTLLQLDIIREFYSGYTCMIRRQVPVVYYIACQPGYKQMWSVIPLLAKGLP